MSEEHRVAAKNFCIKVAGVDQAHPQAIGRAAVKQLTMLRTRDQNLKIPEHSLSPTHYNQPIQLFRDFKQQFPQLLAVAERVLAVTPHAASMCTWIFKLWN